MAVACDVGSQYGCVPMGMYPQCDALGLADWVCTCVFRYLCVVRYLELCVFLWSGTYVCVSVVRYLCVYLWSGTYVCLPMVYMYACDCVPNGQYG